MTFETSTVRVGELSAYLARPDGGSASGMLLLPMITGIGEQVRAWADELAGRGITALAWDVFHGASTDNTSREDLGAKLGDLRDETALAEQTALLDHLLGELGCASAGVMGWCLGGRFALLLGSRDQRLSGVVAYHPTIRVPAPPNHELDAVALSTSITAPVLVAYPEADTVVSHETFARLQTALQSRPRGATFSQHFPGAEHGFSDSSRHGTTVNADAFALSWPQTLAFLDTLKG
ncbi:dienelactone hydrolase family protein [Amycolatopsis sp. FBCC-B4732]|uniref:dienelactone hydrolase family protein n=1 Tax=Amycolatopsis sp. FBCC-B4732 TaxID=3079339 RepID=UPI001FF34188|nr:dienelactone hydrolase family protein [Amycolatopsis sp. FBCC-B4732]UOX86054.1 dienelactone hydrolase family protein [Amycolatopsis sp. FBCC-B4732]